MCIVPTVIAFLVVVFPSAARAWDNLDIPAELRRPGVRLVVLEFYADWCKPCKAAVPKWNELHERYKDRGLRFIVISVGEGGTCSNPGWQPDKVVCDFDGKLQEAFGANSLPQAFLYSWQGNLLVKNGHFEEVRRAVEAYYKSSPRILVSDPEDQDGKKVPNGAALREIIRTDLRRLAKFEMVASDKELASLRELQRKGYGLNYDDAGRCELGREVSANSELKVKVVTMGKERMLVLQLYSVESGCMLASSKARFVAGDEDGAAFEAVSSLVESLIGPPSRGEAAARDVKKDYASSTETTASKLIENARRRKERIEAAWKAVQRALSEPALTTEEKVGILREFLGEFKTNNPYHAKAKKKLLSFSNITVKLEFEAKAPCRLSFREPTSDWGGKELYSVSIPVGTKEKMAFVPPGNYVVNLYCYEDGNSWEFCSHGRKVVCGEKMSKIAYDATAYDGCVCPRLLVQHRKKRTLVREILRNAIGPDGAIEDILPLGTSLLPESPNISMSICGKPGELAFISSVHVEAEGRRIDVLKSEGLEVRFSPQIVFGGTCTAFTFRLPSRARISGNLAVVVRGWYLPYKYLFHDAN